MVRSASGKECIEAARQLLKSARTAEELRTAQAVLLPLEMGLNLEQTAKVIGRSKGATCNMRTRFVQVNAGLRPAPRSKRTLRNRANADLEREKQILDEVLAAAATGGIVAVPQIKPEVEALLGKFIALSTLYRMLARHGWRKLAPDSQHPQGDPETREAWKKNFQTNWLK
jgi:transposase